MEAREKKIYAPQFQHLLLFLLIYILGRGFLESTNTSILGYSEFKTNLSQGKIKNITFRGEVISGEFITPQNGKNKFETVLPSEDALKIAQNLTIPYRAEKSSSFFENAFIFITPMVLLFLFWFYLFRQGVKRLGGGSGSFLSVGKSRAKIYVQKDIKITFKDVAGVDEAMSELKEVIDFLKDAQKMKSLGGKMPKGILLVGPPGTGKTLLAKAIAGEANVPFFSTNGAEFVEMFVGVGAARVRDLFEQAKKSAPCIIFIDELDALGKTRHTSLIGGNDEKEQTLNQLLVEMDGFDTQGGIIILAATNRPEMIDPALLRAGRFDRQVAIDKPDKNGRKNILSLHCQKIKTDPDLKLDDIAGLTPGFTGADLANLVNEAALLATRENAHSVNNDHFTRAMERIIAGIEKKNKILSPKEKEIVSIHEMGHALCTMGLTQEDKIHKVSIIPHGLGSMGHTMGHSLEEKYMYSKNELENKIAVLLAGRVAEELVYSQITTGASDDLAKATTLAQEMIYRYAMSDDLGAISFKLSPASFLEEAEFGRGKNYSEQTANKIDAEIKKIIEGSYQKAKDFLSLNRELLKSTAKHLQEAETLNTSELEEVAKQLRLKSLKI